MKKTTLLRMMLKDPEILLVPVVYDCMTARIAETVGFKAVFMPVSITTMMQIGLPPIGLATASEIINCVKYTADAVNVPLILSADDGYGGTLAAYRTTQEVIRAGAAGMSISDRVSVIKTTVPHNLIEVLSRDEYFGKMGAVVEARNNGDKDFVVIARIEAGALLGDEEVIARAKGCLALGVDVILPHSRPKESKFGVRTKADLKELYKKIGAPEAMIWGMGPRGFTGQDYRDVGARMWAPNDSPTDIAQKALFGLYQELYDTKKEPVSDGTPVRQFSDKIKGMDYWRGIEKKHLP
jgi:2-methylisocitrate lyase-like PEP mutase family enzyme